MFHYSVPVQAHTGGYAVITDRFALVLDAEYPSSRVLALWETLSEAESTLEDGLTMLARYGTVNLPNFVLIELAHAATESVTIAVRGTAFAELGQQPSRRYTGEQAVTWVEASVQQFDAMRIGVGEAAASAQWLPMRRGVVRTSELSWGIAPSSELVAEVDQSAITEGTTLTARVRRSSEEADDQTLLSLRKQQPEWQIHFEFGKKVAIRGAAVLGRKPKPVEGYGAAAQEILISPKREISATHALLTVHDDALHVRDLQSTNGTVVLPSEGETVLLTDGAETELHEGDRVDFGDGNIGVCVRVTQGVNTVSADLSDRV